MVLVEKLHLQTLAEIACWQTAPCTFPILFKPKLLNGHFRDPNERYLVPTYYIHTSTYYIPYIKAYVRPA